MEYKRVIEEFQYSGSIKQTAEALGISINTVRRVLITEGLWSSKSSIAIGELHQQGLSVKEIAAQLHMTVGNVQAYLPYTKGIYAGEAKSNDAVRCDRYRTRRSRDQQIQEMKHGGNTVERPMVQMHSEKTPTGVLHLRLSLVLDQDDRQTHILREYGKMDKGITRDVLVPSSITLHAMHYLIQRAFGWKNEHSHYFALPEEIFDSLTQNRFEQWAKLCGVFFRFTDMENAENFWDDDYDGKTSFRSWLRTKYCGPYDRFPASELYAEAQKRINAFYQANPTISVWDRYSREQEKVCDPREATLGEVLYSGYLGCEANELLERLTIAELLNGTEQFSGTKELIYHYYLAGPDWQVKISLIPNEKNGDSSVNASIGLNGIPVCIAQDGLELIESLRGIEGFCDFLVGINSQNSRQRKRYQEDAELYGWANRRRALSDVI